MKTLKMRKILNKPIAVLWAYFVIQLRMMAKVFSKVRDSLWNIFSAYFVMLVVNLLLWTLLQTEQIKENSEIFFAEHDDTRRLIFFASVLFFTLTNHLAFIAIHKYYLSDITKESNSNDLFSSHLTSREYKIVPFIFSSIILIVYLIYIEPFIRDNDTSYKYISFIFIVFLGILELYASFKSDSFSKVSLGNFFDYYNATKLKFDFIEDDEKRTLWYKFIFFTFLLISYGILALESGSQYIIKLFSSQSIIFIGFSYFILFYTEFIVIPKVNQIKTFAIIWILILLFSLNNDPSAPEYLERDIKSKRLNYKEHFANWVKSKNVSPGETLPLILVAAEGGGIRSMSWTLLTLDYFSKKISKGRFNKSIYAISGVSGGAVGAAFYTTLLKEQLINKNARVTDSTITDIILQDYLSDIVRGNVFRSPLRHISPWKISLLDRNKMLEDSWASEYENLTHSKSFDEPFLNLWNQDTTYQVPSLILNGTFAETGQKALISNIDFSDSIRNVIDVYSLIDPKADIPTKTAASLAARFPIVTSGGLIKDYKGKISGHITDGGYHDNTGLETCIQVLNLLKPLIESEKSIKIEPYIFFLKSSSNLDSAQKKPYRLAYEFSSILGSFYNSWDRGAQTKNSIYKDLLKNTPLNTEYVLIELSRTKGDYPLGWQISRNSIKNMKYLVSELEVGKKTVASFNSPFTFPLVPTLSELLIIKDEIEGFNNSRASLKNLKSDLIKYKVEDSQKNKK